MKKNIILIKDTSPASDTTRDVYAAFVNKLRGAGLEGSVQAVRAADIGVYGCGVAVKILPDGPLYVNVTEAAIDRIVDKTLKQGIVLDDLVKADASGQVRIVLRNCGVIDPENINDYFHLDGYQGLGRCLFDLTPEQVIDEVKKGGLRGRGGAGYPAYLKWTLARKAFGEEK